MCYNPFMKPVLSSGEIYSERKLTELLEFVTKDLQPGPGYKLTLEGLTADKLVHKELEAFFGASLDASAGAKVELGFNALTDQLVLQELAFPIKGTDGVAKLLRTDTIGYIPSIEMRQQPFRATSQFMSYEDGQKLLAGFGIFDIPSYDPIAYKEWRAELLSKTKGWHLVERLEVPLGVTDLAVQTTTLTNEQSFNALKSEVVRSRSFTRSIMMFNDNQETVDHTDSVIESSPGNVNEPVRIYTQTYTRSIDPFAMNTTSTTEPILKPIALDEDSYTDFSNALSEVAQQISVSA